MKKKQFRKLNILDLSWNKIEDLKGIEGSVFERLYSLQLRHNNIKEINLKKRISIKTSDIYLNDNQIMNLEGIEYLVEFLYPFSCLYLIKNNISDIKILEKAFQNDKYTVINFQINKINYSVLQVIYINKYRESRVNKVEICFF